MNFETMIREALNEGKSLEDIASEVGATLNKVQNETKVANAKAKMLDDWEDAFNKHYVNDRIDLNDVAHIASIVCAEAYPNWTLKDLENFHEGVKRTISSLADMQTKKPGEILHDLFSEMFEPETRGKREKKSDSDRIREFLDKL